MYLTRVVLATDSKKSLERVRKVLGDRSYQTLQEKTTKRVNALAELALDAYRSKVPIAGGQLRNSNIRLEKATPQSGIASVIVDGSHKSVNRKLASAFGEISQADILAQVLDIGTYGKGRLYLRTQNSQAINPFSGVGQRSFTKGWITKARQAFAQARRGLK